LSPQGVEKFLVYAQELGFRGFSVTMPLKEVVGKFLDATYGIATEIGAINTITLSATSKIGYNTDGDAVTELLQEKLALHNKRVVILGAGGAAKAIACALHKHGTKLIILNRTLEKAKELAAACSGEGYALSQFAVIVEQKYDILINCTSIGMTSTPGCPIPLASLLPNQIVMDIISHPKETPLLVAAKQINCITIPGESMFLRQAEKQFSLWFSSK
jgi:3-dehydroquinate dehydratase/shikimate dehydrogenase